MTYGPIITAITDGHFERTSAEHPLRGKCETCQTKWPCDTMKKAVKAQPAYAEKVARQARHDNALAMRPVTSGRP